MKDYVQPKFYRFNEDSLALSHFIKKNEKGRGSLERALEIGAGCGVITGELLQALEIQNVLVLEKQGEFMPFLKENLKEFHEVTLLNDDFEQYAPSSPFDLIYFNPPYFFEEDSRPSPDPLTKACRQMKKESFHHWLSQLRGFLKPQGRVYFCHRLSDWKAEDYQLREHLKETQKGCTLYSWDLF